MKENKIIVNNIFEKQIEVATYLTYPQIEAVVKAVCKFDTWSERQQQIDLLILHFATNLTDEEITQHDHDEFLQSGLIDAVKESIVNYDRIQEAIDYTESTNRTMLQIAKELPDLLKPLKEVIKNGNKPSKKR